MASEEQKDLGKKASSRLKTIMNWSQWTLSFQAPEKRDCPIPGRNHVSVWFSNTSLSGVSTFQGRNLCDHSQSPYCALHTLHKGFCTCVAAQGKAAQWGLICPCPALSNTLLHAISCGALSHPGCNSPVGSHSDNTYGLGFFFPLNSSKLFTAHGILNTIKMLV